MSSDDGYILRKDKAQGQYVLQHYFASYGFPPIDVATEAERFDSIEKAVLKFNELDRSEYGLRTRL